MLLLPAQWNWRRRGKKARQKAASHHLAGDALCLKNEEEKGTHPSSPPKRDQGAEFPTQTKEREEKNLAQNRNPPRNRNCNQSNWCLLFVCLCVWVLEFLGLSVRKEFKAQVLCVCDSEGNKYFIITSVTLARPPTLDVIFTFCTGEFSPLPIC